MSENGDRKFQKTLDGIQYLIRDSENLREDLREYSRVAAEDRKQAAEDRREFKELIRGVRQALVVIGTRGGEFVEIQRKQGRQIDLLIDIQRKQEQQLERLIDISEANTRLLRDIHRDRRNGKPGNGSHPK